MNDLRRKLFAELTNAYYSFLFSIYRNQFKVVGDDMHFYYYSLAHFGNPTTSRIASEGEKI